LALFLLVKSVDFEKLRLDSTVSRDRIYVSWTEQWDVARYVEHYIAERKLRGGDELRTALRQRVAKYPWPGPRKKAEMDRYLDSGSSKLRAG
jgi:hypothetical protein